MPRPNKAASKIAKGRVSTDRSLGAERKKADDTITDRQGKVQRRTDRDVERTREQADSVNRRVRGSADRSLAAKRAGLPTSRASERKDADRRMDSERESADRMLAAERERTDVATERERAATEAAQRDVFKSERMHTDRDLSDERGFIDAENARTAEAILEAATANRRAAGELALRDDFLTLLGRHLRQPMLEISVAAERLREGGRFQQSDEHDRGQVDVISRNSQEVLRLIGDLLERVAIWSPPSVAERRPAARGRGGTKARRK